MNKINLIETFTIQDAINADIESDTVFILANERLKKNKSVGRYYTIFPSFKSFLRVRESYKHCHEILLDHKNNKKNSSGRLVFDFDIKSNYIPNDFKEQIQNTIHKVVDMYMKNVDTDKFEFVWSTSDNPKKFSKHLTVKNMYFDDWIFMSNSFYKLFCDVWDKTYSWIKSRNLIDFQIVKKNTSLRMVGSSKMDGNILSLDDLEYRLEDSLIRVYLSKQRKREKMITKDNFIDIVFETVLKPPKKIHYYRNNDDEPCFIGDDVYKKAYLSFNNIYPKVFGVRKADHGIVHLLRKKSSKCVLCEKIHDSENAWLRVILDEEMYTIHFHCYRNYEKKSLYIGSLSTDNLIFFVNPELQRNLDNNLNI
uniref:Uncharacterized protein n=1 Tax=viral metagenome TaxID=1070528 RepID=A0A6C0CAN7_9ZZZZ